MRKKVFSFCQGLKRIVAHPWLSFVFFCAIISIGAIIGAFIGYDSSMLKPDVLPYQQRDQVLRLITSDEAVRDTMMNAPLEGIEKRCLVVQQDVQCFSETKSDFLKVESVVSDEENVLPTIDLAPDEAGMTRKSLHRTQLKAGEKLMIDGTTYTIKELPYNIDPGTDVLLKGTIPNGIHSYLVALELAEGFSPEQFKETIASAWNLSLMEEPSESAVQYEIPSVVWEDSAAYIWESYSRSLMLSILGVLFGVSQLSALMSYLISKCSMRNALSLQWTGHRGLLLEFITTISVLSLPGLPIGFLLGTYLENTVQGGSPALRDSAHFAFVGSISTLAVWMILILLLCYQMRHWHEGTAWKGEEE